MGAVDIIMAPKQVKEVLAESKEDIIFAETIRDQNRLSESIRAAYRTVSAYGRILYGPGRDPYRKG